MNLPEIPELRPALSLLGKEQGYRTLNRLCNLHKALVADGGDYDIDFLTAEDLALGNTFTRAEAEALLFVIADANLTAGDVTQIDQVLKFGW